MALLEAKDIDSILQEVVDTILIPRFNELGMNATGNWIEQLEVRSEVDNNFGLGVIRGEKYSEQLAYGRKPGAAPPIQPLIEWVQAKMGLSGQQAVSAAFAISKKIANEGTTWYQKGGTDLIEILSSKEVVDLITQRISVLLVANSKAEIQRELKELVA